MSEEFFIEDGYNREERISAEPGLHPALWIKYRPALMEQRFALGRARDHGPEEQAKITATIISKHLLDWNATKGGVKCDTKPETIRKLQPTLQSKILDIVLGYAGSVEEAGDVKN